jgi:hypothetical protein
MNICKVAEYKNTDCLNLIKLDQTFVAMCSSVHTAMGFDRQADMNLDCTARRRSTIRSMVEIITFTRSG